MNFHFQDGPIVDSIVGVCLAMLDDEGLVEDVIRHAIDCAWDEGHQEGYDAGYEAGLNTLSPADSEAVAS